MKKKIIYTILVLFFTALLFIMSICLSGAQAQVQVDLFNSTEHLQPNILLQWQYPYEFRDTAGYNVYRKSDGNYVKINDQLIPAEGTESDWIIYEITDLAIKKGGYYSYKIEEIKKNGASFFSEPESWIAE